MTAVFIIPETSRLFVRIALEFKNIARLTIEHVAVLTGILHNRLGRVLTQAAGIGANRFIAELSDGELEQLAALCKGFDVSLTEPMGMDSAQVTAGDILTRDFDDTTMQSRLVPGLYACGEVLDIDGDCGGYNLQWAWSSGRTAGCHAGGIT